MNRPQVQLRVLVVDDEAPSLADLVFELHRLPTIGHVTEASDATEALRAIRNESFDAVFLDVRMPGLDGIELARVLQAFKSPPPIVFVTAFDAHAVDAFEINAVDYLLKPVRQERLEQAVAKILARLPLEQSGAQVVAAGSLDAAPLAESPSEVTVSLDPSDAGARSPFDDDLISVESGGRIRFVDRRNVQYVASSGDYVRLHLDGTSVLVRVAMATLEERWASAGFVRIHRSYLVAFAHIDEVRIEAGRGYVVRIGDRSLPVSRRLAGPLRARLVEDATRRSRRDG